MSVPTQFNLVMDYQYLMLMQGTNGILGPFWKHTNDAQYLDPTHSRDMQSDSSMENLDIHIESNHSEVPLQTVCLKDVI